MHSDRVKGQRALAAAAMAEELQEEKKLGSEGRAGQGIVAVNPKPSSGIAARAIDYAEKLVVMLMYGTCRPLH